MGPRHGKRPHRAHTCISPTCLRIRWHSKNVVINDHGRNANPMSDCCAGLLWTERMRTADPRTAAPAISDAAPSQVARLERSLHDGSKSDPDQRAQDPCLHVSPCRPFGCRKLLHACWGQLMLYCAVHACKACICMYPRPSQGSDARAGVTPVVRCQHSRRHDEHVLDILAKVPTYSKSCQYCSQGVSPCSHMQSIYKGLATGPRDSGQSSVR